MKGGLQWIYVSLFHFHWICTCKLSLLLVLFFTSARARQSEWISLVVWKGQQGKLWFHLCLQSKIQSLFSSVCYSVEAKVYNLFSPRGETKIENKTKVHVYLPNKMLKPAKGKKANWQKLVTNFVSIYTPVFQK